MACITQLLIDISANVLAGVLLALLLFWAREKWFPLPAISGQWYFETRTTESSYAPYRNMTLRYVVVIWREGSKIQGTAEKLWEYSTREGTRSYDGANRTRSKVEGYIEKSYFGPDRMLVHIVEEGHKRESTNFHDLVVTANDRMPGTFVSMVANQKGTALWQRSPFPSE